MEPLREPDRFARILIVEDDPAQRAILSDVLRHEGFQVIATATARQALDAVHRESFGVAIIDYKLPDTTGIQLLKQLKAMNGRVRAIIHTGCGTFDSARDAVNLGAFAYVEKGGDPRELIRHVHRAVQSHYAKYTGDLESAIAERTASLRESEERYRILVELCPDGIAIHDARNFIYANPIAAKLLGAAAPIDLIGSKLCDFIPEARRELVRAQMDRILNEKLAMELGEFHIRTADNLDLDVEIRGVFVLVGGDPSAQLLLRDVTLRNRAAEERRLLDARLRDSQKMEAAGQLAAGIAHDFNNLLTVILGNGELLREKLRAARTLDKDDLPVIEQIEQAGNRAAALTARLLAFSRRQPVQLKVLNLNRVLAGLEDLLRRLLGETVQFALALSEGELRIEADESQLEQVMLNLALNARDAIQSGGAFSVQTDFVVPDAGFFTANADLDRGPYARLIAADTGCGILPETLEHVFEPFFTTKPSGKGTGLGLATVYGVVRQAGGAVEVQSKPGTGTTFTIYWPLARHPADAQPNIPDRTSPATRGTILICEDDELVLNVTGQMLRAQGFEVFATSTAAQAVRLSDALGPQIDLLLSDILMPDLRGPELAQKLRERNPGLRVLLMSGCPSENPEQKAEMASEYAVIGKPFKSQDLLHKIQQVLSEPVTSIFSPLYAL
ncbi:MAG TPA: response regulator [Phycisphaerae bacterium]|nr:response regulator [Phycisphaerae bacterium]